MNDGDDEVQDEDATAIDAVAGASPANFIVAVAVYVADDVVIAANVAPYVAAAAATIVLDIVVAVATVVAAST